MKKGSKNAKYGARSRGWGRGISSESMRGKREELEKKDGESGRRRSWINDEVDLYKNREGPNRLRLIPPIEADELEYYGYEVWMHPRVGNNNDTFLCYNRMRGEACARCERQKDLWDDDFDLAKQLYPTKRVLIWVQDLLDDEEPETPLLFDCPKSLAAEILKRSEKKREGKPTGVYVDPSHPTDGRCVTYDYVAPVRGKKGKGGEPGKYVNVALEDDPAPDLEESIIDELVPFEDCLNHHEYEELQEVDSGGLSGGYEKEEEEEPEESDDFASMDRLGLKRYIKENDLDIKVMKSMTDDDIRKAIIQTVEPEKEEEEEAPNLAGMDRRELKAFIKENVLDVKVRMAMSDDDIRDIIKSLLEASEREEEPEEEEGINFDEMGRRELKMYIKENDLDIIVKKSMSDNDIREAIVEEIPPEESKEDKRSEIRRKLDEMKQARR